MIEDNEPIHILNLPASFVDTDFLWGYSIKSLVDIENEGVGKRRKCVDELLSF